MLPRSHVAQRLHPKVISLQHQPQEPRSSEHFIFKVCFRCSYNTKDDPNGIERKEPTFFCPSCGKPSFVTACTACQFENSPSCPLTQLLAKRPKEVPKCPLGSACQRAEGDDRDRGKDDDRKQYSGPPVAVAKDETKRGGSRRPNLEPGERDATSRRKLEERTKPSSADIVKRYKASREAAKMNPKPSPEPAKQPSPPLKVEPPKLPSQTPAPPTITPHEIRTVELRHPPRDSLYTLPPHPLEPPDPAPTIERPVVETTQNICSQCTQPHCASCLPGYMNLVVDMKEFSITFASDIKLCTMCEHWMCPGSLLEVLYRCRECGHQGCDDCLAGRRPDEFGEEWCVCCECGASGVEGEDVIKSVEGESPLPERI